jgi:hypothetical protein
MLALRHESLEQMAVGNPGKFYELFSNAIRTAAGESQITVSKDGVSLREAENGDLFPNSLATKAVVDRLLPRSDVVPFGVNIYVLPSGDDPEAAGERLVVIELAATA